MSRAFMDRIIPFIDKTISELAKVKFFVDPIAGPKYSRSTSIISSAYKRHGKILELSLIESLKDSNRHHVWQEDVFRISRAAGSLVDSQDELASLGSVLPYGECYRKLQIDMLVFDDANNIIRSYEIKRGNGQFDAGKIRSIKRDLLCTQVLLQSYGEAASYAPKAAQTHIIFYYGVCSIRQPWSLTRDELDGHFGCAVIGKIEQANDYFRSKLYQILDAA